jgi:hypothetical protein
MKICTGEALSEKKSIHTLKSNRNRNNLIVNQCARTLPCPIPCMSIKAAINIYIYIYLFIIYLFTKIPVRSVRTAEQVRSERLWEFPLTIKGSIQYKSIDMRSLI